MGNKRKWTHTKKAIKLKADMRAKVLLETNGNIKGHITVEQADQISTVMEVAREREGWRLGIQYDLIRGRTSGKQFPFPCKPDVILQKATQLILFIQKHTQTQRCALPCRIQLYWSQSQRQTNSHNSFKNCRLIQVMQLNTEVNSHGNCLDAAADHGKMWWQTWYGSRNKGFLLSSTKGTVSFPSTLFLPLLTRMTSFYRDINKQKQLLLQMRWRLYKLSFVASHVHLPVLPC